MQFELNPFFLCLLLGGASIAHISIIYIMLFKLDEKRTKMKLNWTIGFFLDRLIYVFLRFCFVSAYCRIFDVQLKRCLINAHIHTNIRYDWSYLAIARKKIISQLLVFMISMILSFFECYSSQRSCTKLNSYVKRAKASDRNDFTVLLIFTRR